MHTLITCISSTNQVFVRFSKNIIIVLYVCCSLFCELLCFPCFTNLTVKLCDHVTMLLLCWCCFSAIDYFIQFNVRIKRIAPSMEQAFAQIQLIPLLLKRIVQNTAIYVPALIVVQWVSFYFLFHSFILAHRCSL